MVFIDQLIDYPINCISLQHQSHRLKTVNSKTYRGLYWFYWHKIFTLRSNVVKYTKWLFGSVQRLPSLISETSQKTKEVNQIKPVKNSGEVSWQSPQTLAASAQEKNLQLFEIVLVGYRIPLSLLLVYKLALSSVVFNIIKCDITKDTVTMDNLYHKGVRRDLGWSGNCGLRLIRILISRQM